MIDSETMSNLQALSRLKLTPDEARNLAGQLEDIIEYFELLSAYETDGVDTDLGIEVPPAGLRKDLKGHSVDRATIESFAVDFDDGFFVVPRILGDEPDA
jgi:aspartyl-tRNA(Asn)/glutamyl-tRNA(Gln) amidotransferase subunit C